MLLFLQDRTPNVQLIVNIYLHFIKISFNYEYVSAYIAHVSGYSERPEEDVRSPEAGITNCYELKCWELNKGPLKVIAFFFLDLRQGFSQ